MQWLSGRESITARNSGCRLSEEPLFLFWFDCHWPSSALTLSFYVLFWEKRASIFERENEMAGSTNKTPPTSLVPIPYRELLIKTDVTWPQDDPGRNIGRPAYWGDLAATGRSLTFTDFASLNSLKEIKLGDQVSCSTSNRMRTSNLRHRQFARKPVLTHFLMALRSNG